jgi:surface antigen
MEETDWRKAIIHTNILRKALQKVRRLRVRAKEFRTNFYRMQNHLVCSLKQKKTFHFLYLFRQYSAMTVVVGSAVLVTGTNIVARNEVNGFLFGYFKETSRENGFSKPKIAGQASKKNSLSLVPLLSASAKIDPNAKDTVLSVADMTTTPQGSQIIATSLGMMKDPEEDGGVSIYTVKEGDTVSGIAARNFITVNTILWANDLDNVNAIKPGDQIFILPVAGVTHTVVSGETIDTIAQKYHADKERIIAFNELPATGDLKVDQEIVIPDGQKEMPKPVQETTTTSDSLRRQYATSAGDGVATDISSGWKKLDGKAGAGHRFPYGYCTWYVAQKRFVPWSGNAGAWLYNAKSQGYRTGKSPAVGSIAVTTDSPYYGHVALVESVGNGTITVSEMNFKAWGKVNKRVISTSSRSIKGYIY